MISCRLRELDLGNTRLPEPVQLGSCRLVRWRLDGRQYCHNHQTKVILHTLQIIAAGSRRLSNLVGMLAAQGASEK